MVTFGTWAASMSDMAMPMVWQGVNPEDPQQAAVSLPSAPSTSKLPPATRAGQQMAALSEHVAPVEQSASLVQLALQALAPQMNGAQAVVPGAGQLPWLSHTL